MKKSDRDDLLDETIDETFPASDPPANTVEIGVHVHPVPPPAVEADPAGQDRPASSRPASDKKP